MEIDINETNQWLVKRRKTFIAFCAVSFGLGFEIALTFPSLYFYMHDIIQASNSELMYGIALSAYPLASILGALTIGKYADRTKRARSVILFLLSCEVIGNLLYSLGYTPWLPVIGRLIAGCGDVASMVIVGEIQRSYRSDEITKRLSATVVCFSIGFILSPATTILFKHFDFYIGSLRVAYANMASLVSTLIFITLWTVAYFMVFDLSREYDLKDTNAKSKLREEKKALCVEKSDFRSKEETPLLLYGEEDTKQFIEINAFKSIFTSLDLVLLLAFCFVCSFTLFGFDTLLPLIGSKYFNFNVVDTSMIYIIDGIVYGLVLIILGKLSTRYTDFTLVTFAVVIALLGLISILIIHVYHSNVYFNYVCLVFYVTAFSCCWCIEEVLTISLFGKLVPSSCQVYAEGIRRSTTNMAFIVSGVANAGLLEHLASIVITLILLLLILLAMFLYRKKSFLNPKPQF